MTEVVLNEAQCLHKVLKFCVRLLENIFDKDGINYLSAASKLLKRGRKPLDRKSPQVLNPLRITSVTKLS